MIISIELKEKFKIRVKKKFNQFLTN